MILADYLCEIPSGGFFLNISETNNSKRDVIALRIDVQNFGKVQTQTKATARRCRQRQQDEKKCSVVSFHVAVRYY